MQSLRRLLSNLCIIKEHAVDFLKAVLTYGLFLGAFPDPHPRKNEPQSKRGTNLPELFVVVA